MSVFPIYIKRYQQSEKQFWELWESIKKGKTTTFKKSNVNLHKRRKIKIFF